MTDLEKNHEKIKRSDSYALKNVEILSAEELSSSSSRLHVKALGNSMNGAGVFADDLLIIDRSIEAKPGHVILALIFGQFTLKRYQCLNGKTFLLPENNEYKTISVTPETNFKIIGVLTFNIHKHT
jgi:DNA polymerase V